MVSKSPIPGVCGTPSKWPINGGYYLPKWDVSGSGGGVRILDWMDFFRKIQIATRMKIFRGGYLQNPIHFCFEEFLSLFQGMMD